MKRAICGVMAAVALWGGAFAAWADTFLVQVTPKNLDERKFRITGMAAPKDQVEFAITRDIRGIDGPGRSAYFWNSKLERKGLGTQVKLEEDSGKTLNYRFPVPKAQVSDTVFTLWGQGIHGEGITFELKLADFWKP